MEVQNFVEDAAGKVRDIAVGFVDELEYVGKIREGRPQAFAGETAVAATLESPEALEKTSQPQLYYEDVKPAVDFMGNQIDRLRQIGGVAAEFAERMVMLSEGVDDLRKCVRAYKAREQLSEKFGVERENLNLVVSKDREGQPELVLMDTGPTGIYKGNYLKISTYDKAEDYEVEVDGEKVDVRYVMTEQLYRDFIEAEKKLGTKPLPDSGFGRPVDSNQDPDLTLSEGTWIFGRPDHWDTAQLARVGDTAKIGRVAILKPPSFTPTPHVVHHWKGVSQSEQGKRLRVGVPIAKLKP